MKVFKSFMIIAVIFTVTVFFASTSTNAGILDSVKDKALSAGCDEVCNKAYTECLDKAGAKDGDDSMEAKACLKTKDLCLKKCKG